MVLLSSETPQNKSHNVQNRRSCEIPRRIFETDKNAIRPQCCHIYNTAADMHMTTTCPCNSKHHELPKWKCVLRCCDECPSIVLPIQEANKDRINTYSKIIFHVYHNLSRCTVHDWHPFEKITTCLMCSTVWSSD